MITISSRTIEGNRQHHDPTASSASVARTHPHVVTHGVAQQARLLDVVQGRSGRAVTDWLTDRGDDWCDRVQVAALDPFRGYEVALRGGLHEAAIVLPANSAAGPSALPHRPQSALRPHPH
jgi:transposase